MAISTMGRQYICANFGSYSQCCVKSGLSWYYTVGGSNTNESGGTAQIVSRFASGLIDSLTMTYPARGMFTKAQLDAANGSEVTLTDAQTITQHDETTEDQWCFIPCTAHTDQYTCETEYNCYWYNGSCHTNAPSCIEITNEADCLTYGCYWWNGTCHDVQPTCSQLTTQTECLSWGCYWYNNSCHDSIICDDIITQSECLSLGCYWYNNGCHSTAPTCEQLNTETECLAWNCYWYNGSCHSSVVCTTINNITECQAHGCYWWNGTCHATPPTCTELNNESDCLGYGCFWYGGTCHSTDQPNLCYWIDAQGGPLSLDITDVFVIIDAFLYGTPPSGYTFVPTLTNVFGVIDYFLGFDGDAKTGCNYY